MTTTIDTAPVTGRDRMVELDIIRGFALFGVLWMNLFEHVGFIIPPDHAATLPTAPVDDVVGFFSVWLMLGKAQALFSFLFGLGFALFLERAVQRGANGTILYLRRLTFLLVLGVAHACLLWIGDILNAYAAMGFVLILTRRLPSRWLLGLGLGLFLFGGLAFRLTAEFWLVPPGTTPWWETVAEEGVVRRFALFQTADYPAYAQELTTSLFRELYLTPVGPLFLSWVLARFMIGSWIYRQGWMQDTARYAVGFRRWAPRLLVSGLILAAAGPTLGLLEIRIPPPYAYAYGFVPRLALILLPFGYAATIVVLCQNPVWRRRLSGLGAAGQMALTNYLTQSLLYFFLLYGFGFGLLPWLGATMALGIALVFYAAQIAFSRWWLARYRFGPMEWLWRSATYGAWQPLRLAAPSAAVAATT